MADRHRNMPVQAALTMLVFLLAAIAGGCSSVRELTSDPQTMAGTLPPPRAPASVPRPPPAMAVPAVARSTASSVSNYRIGVGDTVRISVHGEPDLTLDFVVSESGIVNYPFLGDLPVRGQSVGQLQQRIDHGLRGDYLVNPDVRVVVTAYRHFFVNGEVRLPGGYPFLPGLTVRQAAALAGGFTERASMNKISIYRESTPTIEQSASLDTLVFPGDTVIVEQGLF